MAGKLKDKPKRFNPRAPCGARLVLRTILLPRPAGFNPRAPCGARQYSRMILRTVSLGFNPRAPCGARPASEGRKAILIELFQSTRPVRGATH